jgi:transcriptional regulator CtsR
VTAEEASLMASAVSSRALGIPVPDAMKGALRARMMKSMLMTIAARNRT